MLIQKRFADSLEKIKTGPNKYQYESLKTDSVYTITINSPQCHNMCSCTCKTFVKTGVCMHVVAMSNIYGLNLFHPKYLSKKNDHFETKVKRGRKSKKDYGKANDKPEPVPVPSCTSTPTQKVAPIEAP